MIDHQIDDDLHASAVGLSQKRIKVRQRAKFRLDGLIIADIIAVISAGRPIKGRQPDHIHAQLLQIRQPGSHTGQIADAITVGVLKAAGVNLIHHRFFPPYFLHFHFLQLHKLYQIKRFEFKKAQKERSTCQESFTACSLIK